jgi:hypothetical protein
MTERERILNRVVKLLALADSPNVNEAATAKKMADGLMVKHGLSKDDVTDSTSSGFYELPMGVKGFESVWKFSLITATARFCGCEAISLQVGKRRKLRLVGERSNVERAAELFGSLMTSLRDLEKLEASWVLNPSVIVCTPPEVYLDSFRRGATVAIIELMMQQQPERFGRKRRNAREPKSETTEAPSPVPETFSEESEKAGLFSKLWPWKKSDRKVVSELPASAVMTQSLSLVLARSEKTDGSERHREKVKSKYAPRKVRLDLENAEDDGAYRRGYQLARRLVKLPLLDEDGLRDGSSASTPGTRAKNE